jgi:hypothetical protein
MNKTKYTSIGILNAIRKANPSVATATSPLHSQGEKLTPAGLDTFLREIFTAPPTGTPRMFWIDGVKYCLKGNSLSKWKNGKWTCLTRKDHRKMKIIWAQS